MIRNNTDINTKRRKGTGLRVVSLGLVSSVVLLRAIAISDVSAASSNSVTIPGTEPTVLAQAVNSGVLFGSDNAAVWNSTNLDQLQLAQANSQLLDTGGENSLLLSRTRELMELDYRDVDAVAARLKEIIKGRYEADHLYINTLAQADDLRKRLLEFETLLQEANAQQEKLGAEKLDLQNEIDRILSERDNAQNQINTLASEIQSEKQEAVGELSAQLAQLTAEREQAQNHADSVANLLADSEQRLKAVEERLAHVIVERDDVAGSASAAEALLTEKDGLLSDLKAQFENLAAGNDKTRKEAQEVATALKDKEKSLSEIQAQLQVVATERDEALQEATSLSEMVSEKEDALEALRAEVNSLAGERNTAKMEIAAVGELLNEKADLIDELTVNLENLTAETDTAKAQLAEYQSRFEAADALANNFLQERDSLAGTLSLFENKASDFNSALVIEQQEHAETRAAVVALEADASRLQEQFDVVSGERDALLEDKRHLESASADLDNRLFSLQEEVDTRQNELQVSQSSIADLNSQIEQLENERDAGHEAIQALQAELDARQNELQVSQGSIEDLTGQISLLQSERDAGGATMQTLQGDVASLRNELALAKEHAEDQLASANSEFEEQRLRFGSEISEKDQTVIDLDRQLLDLKAEMEQHQSEWQSRVSEKDDEILELQSNIVQLEEDREQLNSLKSQSDLKLGELQEQLSGLTSRHDVSIGQLDELKKLNGKLNRQLEERSTKLKKVTADGAMRLAALKQELLELETNGVTAEEQIKKLSGMNKALEDQLKSMRGQLARANMDGKQKIERLQAQIEKLKAQNADYAAKQTTIGDKLAKTLSANEGLLERVSASDNENKTTAAELEKLKLSLIDYESALNTANSKLREMQSAQLLAEQQQEAQLTEAESLRNKLESELASASLANITVQSARADNAIPIRLGNADFFAPGSAKLTKKGAEKLTSLAKIIEAYDDRRIVVEGHTDTVPISARLKSRFESNWELSVARAATAVRHMQFQSKIDPKNLSAAGYGEYQPVSSNNTVAGRQQNRRVEVLLYPRHEEFTSVSAMEE